MRFENSILIHRPIEEVFNFVADFENMPKWNYFVVNVAKTSAGPVGVGTTYHQIRQSDEQDYKITVFEPNRAVAMHVTSGTDLFMHFTFESDGSATRLTDTWELATGLNRLLDGIARFRIKAAVAANLAKLKELLETGQVQLQDGRVVTL